MSFNILGAITGGLSTLLTTGNPIAAGAGAVSDLFGGASGMQMAATQTYDPLDLENAFAQQPDALQNVNQLSSYANSLSSGNDLFANLIDGDGDDA